MAILCGSPPPNATSMDYRSGGPSRGSRPQPASAWYGSLGRCSAAMLHCLDDDRGIVFRTRDLTGATDRCRLDAKGGHAPPRST